MAIDSEILLELAALDLPQDKMTAVLKLLAKSEAKQESQNAAVLAKRAKDRERKRNVRGMSAECPEPKKKVSFPPPPSPLDGFPDLSLIPPYTPPSLTSKKKAYAQEFEQFWELYPPNAASKTKTYESWQKAIKTGVTHEHLSRTASDYRSYLERTDTPTAHATTWLNQNRWETEYEKLGGHSKINGNYPQSQTTERGGGKGKSALAQAADRAEKRILARFAGNQAENLSRVAGNPDAGSEAASILLDDTGSVRKEGR